MMFKSITNDQCFNIIKAILALIFLMLVLFVTAVFIDYDYSSNNTLLIVAAVIGGYMAINIGANDVANNVGPAVGAGALSLIGAILIAAIFEASGALIAGGDVVGTVKKGIIDPAQIANGETFVWLMMAALLAGALWLNIATFFGAPVSTTHSIVGGILGAGIAASGVDIVNWSKMGAIAASWIISPVMGGMIAAAILLVIKRTITYQTDMCYAAKKVVPILISLMIWAFSTYLILKGLKKIWQIDFVNAVGIGAVIGTLSYFMLRYFISKMADNLMNDKTSVNKLFVIPLIFAVALLSFAHGANDVANAVGPLVAINEVITSGVVAGKAAIPLWVMLIGALGLVVGLVLYGPKLIRTVGSEITELNQIRAFCIAMSASITVIIASQLGLPVSSTHITVGGVFGVGFLREYLKNNYGQILEEIKYNHKGDDPKELYNLLNTFKNASHQEKRAILKRLKSKKGKILLKNKERKKLKKAYKKNLINRSHLLKIVMAWVITIPVSGSIAAMLFFMIRGIMIS